MHFLLSGILKFPFEHNHISKTRMADISLFLPLLGLIAKAAPTPTKAIDIPRGRFDLEKQTDATCQFNFRFKKCEIQQLAVLLEIPNPFRTPCRYNTSNVEALCILLNRFAWPHRLGSMVRLFGRSREALSVIANTTMRHIYDRFHHLLYWDVRRLDESWMEECARVIHARGAPLDSCIGFIDGTVRGICRPSKGVQKAAYNGHKVTIYKTTLSDITYRENMLLNFYIEKTCS